MNLFFRAVIRIIAGLIILVLIVAISLVTVGGSLSQDTSDHLLKSGDPVVFIHRGLPGPYPENSSDAFDACIRRGFTAVETDIRRTKDWKMVVFHDASCLRMLGVDTSLNQLSFSQIRDIPLRSGLQEPGCNILTLDDLLRRYKDSLLFYLDIKEYDLRSADSVIAQIIRHNAFDRVVLASTSMKIIRHVRLEEPRILTSLEGFNAGKGWIFYIIPKRLKPAYYSGFLSRVTEGHMKFLRKNKIANRRVVYGIDSSNYQQAFRLGIPHLILDYDSSFGTTDDIEQQLNEAFSRAN
ncbi:MAG: glycerophosphodiester phosphodiesterase family protein [Bacteroidales bacterium]